MRITLLLAFLPIASIGLHLGCSPTVYNRAHLDETVVVKVGDVFVVEPSQLGQAPNDENAPEVAWVLKRDETDPDVLEILEVNSGVKGEVDSATFEAVGAGETDVSWETSSNTVVDSATWKFKVE
jgi:hypothetical protein